MIGAEETLSGTVGQGENVAMAWRQYDSPQALARGQLVLQDAAFGSGACHSPVVGRQRECVDAPSRNQELRAPAAQGQVPDPHPPIVVAGDQDAAIGGEGHALRDAGALAQGTSELSVETPQLERSSVMGDDQALAIGSKDQVPDLSLNGPLPELAGIVDIP